jgi:group I intron endonuclease
VKLMVNNKNKSGIYKVENIVNGKVYIGKTKNFYKRYHQYLYDIKSKNTNRINRYLLASIEKYGIESFTFKVVEFCDLEDIASRELYWIQELNSTNREYGYNLRLDSSTGMVTHPETSEKISKRLRREWESGARDSHSEKLKLSWKHRDKLVQGLTFSKILTKYKYVITSQDGKSVDMFYRDLKLNALHGVLGKFKKHKSNLVNFKGLIIERILHEDQT